MHTNFHTSKKKLRQSKRKKENETGNVKNMGPKAPSQMMAEVFFEDHNGVLKAEYNNCMYTLSANSLNNVSAGDVWKCYLELNKMTGVHEAFPYMFVSKAAVGPDYKIDENKSEQDPITMAIPEDTSTPTTASVQEPSETMKEKTDKGQIRKMMSENQRLTEDVERLDEENEQLKKSIKELKTHLNNLSGKTSSKNAMANESLLQTKENMIESLELEVKMLREKLQSLGINDLEVVSRHPIVPRAILTGDSTIHCSILDDGPHTVYISPRLRKIRIVPDVNGKVMCRDKTIHVNCISGFSDFERARNLIIENIDDVIEIHF